MNFGTAIADLKAAGLFAEIESDGPAIFVKTENRRGHLVFIRIKSGAVSGAEVRRLIDAT